MVINSRFSFGIVWTEQNGYYPSGRIILMFTTRDKKIGVPKYRGKNKKFPCIRESN